METGNFQGEVTALRAHPRNSTSIVIYIWYRSYFYLPPSLRVWPHVSWEDMSIVLKCKFPRKIHYQLLWERSCSIHYPDAYEGNTWEVLTNLPCDGPCCMVGYMHPKLTHCERSILCLTQVLCLCLSAQRRCLCTSYHYTGSQDPVVYCTLTGYNPVERSIPR